ncbi:MAG: hypothetical protein AAGA96_14765 [Verrucomicrobiota bacterium]
MSERPPIRAQGRITQEHEPGRLYEVTMKNGHRAYAVLERKGPTPPMKGESLGVEVTVDYSPYDMSRCRIVAWVEPEPAAAE